MIAVDIRDLAQFDLKNMDVVNTGRRLFQNPSLLIYTAMVIGTIVGVSQIFDNQRIKVKGAQAEITSLEEKDKSISVLLEAKANIEKFFETLPQGTTELDSIINTLNEFASRRNIQIQSLTPEADKSQDVYDLVQVNLAISTSNYSELGLFIKDIENSKYNLRIDSWQVNLKRPEINKMRSEGMPAMDQVFNISLKISSIKFKK